MKDENIAKFMGMKLIHARVEAGLSQLMLAQEVGISQSQIGKYERGVNRIPPNILSRIAKLLKLDITYFYQDERQVYKDTTKDMLNEMLSDVVSQYKIKLNEAIPIISLQDISPDHTLNSILELRKKPLGYLKIQDEYLSQFQNTFSIKLEDTAAERLGFFPSTFLIFYCGEKDLSAESTFFITVSQQTLQIVAKATKGNIVASAVGSYTRF